MKSLGLIQKFITKHVKLTEVLHHTQRPSNVPCADMPG